MEVLFLYNFVPTGWFTHSTPWSTHQLPRTCPVSISYEATSSWTENSSCSVRVRACTVCRVTPPPCGLREKGESRVRGWSCAFEVQTLAQTSAVRRSTFLVRTMAARFGAMSAAAALRGECCNVAISTRFVSRILLTMMLGWDLCYHGSRSHLIVQRNHIMNMHPCTPPSSSHHRPVGNSASIGHGHPAGHACSLTGTWLMPEFT
jgi:hypothetical protein